MARRQPSTAISTRQPDTLKKNVAAIHTSGDLSLLERKTANVLLLNAYQHLVTRRTHKLPVPVLCAMLGYDSHDIAKLKDALRRLASTTIEFNVMEDGKESWKVMAMLSYGEIDGGVCTYRYDEYLAERLYDPEIYATINMAVQRKFESGYALTLYENCLRYRAVGSTGWWDIDRFRNIMGATAPMYDEFKYLKRDVVTKPLEHVNRVADIRLTAEFQKNGRKVTAVRFLVEDTPQQSLLTQEATDQYADIRTHETYKRLIEHGIGDRLAVLWVMEDEQRARAVVDYVEAKDQKKQVKGTTAGYIRKLIEDGADVGATAYEAKKAQAAKNTAEAARSEAENARLQGLRDDFQRQTVTAAVKALTAEDRKLHAEAYMREAGEGAAASWSAEKLDFTNQLDRVKFSTWLRKRLTPEFDAAAFEAWKKAQRKNAAPGQTQLEGA